MFGKNPLRAATQGDGNCLDVQEIFSTFQGEGPNSGVAAVFIRLGGCNLACDFCDTEFESFNTMALDAIVAEVSALSLNDAGIRVRKLVVITGGEPFRQPITLLCTNLLALGFAVQIETNGTLYRDLPPGVEIICSPKVSNGNYHPIRPDLLERITAFKFLVSADDALYHTVPDLADGHAIPIYIQPIDTGDEAQNTKNLAHAVSLNTQYGYRLSLQTHKIAKVR